MDEKSSDEDFSNFGRIVTRLDRAPDPLREGIVSGRVGGQTFYDLLLALVVGGSLVRIWVCFQHNPLDYLFSDPLRHWLNGQRLLHPEFMGASDPLLYQCYIYLLRATTGDHRWLIASAAAVLSIVMPWTFYRAARECGLSKIAGLCAWALIACNPSLITIYHYTMTETLLLPLGGLSLWMTARYLRKRDLSAFLIAGSCWMLASLTRPTVAPLAAACMIFAWWKQSRKWTDVVALTALVALLLVPNAIRTRTYLGFVAPLGNPWITRIQHRSGARTILIYSTGDLHWGFISPSCGQQPLSPLTPWEIRRSYFDSKVSVTFDPANGRRDWSEAYGKLNIGWREWIAQLGENVLLFLFAPSWPDCDLTEWDGWAAYMSRWLWAPLIFFVIDCNIREFRRRDLALIPLATTTLTLFLMFQNFATTEGRYRKPVEPLLLLNVVWAIAPRMNGKDERLLAGSQSTG